MSRNSRPLLPVGRLALAAASIGTLTLAGGAVLWIDRRERHSARARTATIRERALAAYDREAAGRLSPDILVVVPAFNEEASLGGVLAAIPSTILGRTVEVTVVVDGCSDGTEAVARRAGIPVVHEHNRGQSAALVTGYAAARRRGARLVATLDADGQFVPAELARVVRPLLAGEADLVTGSRALGSARGGSRTRAAGIRVYGWLVSALIRQRITDPSIGMRAITTDGLQRLRLVEERFGAAELVIEARKRGLRIREVPVTVLDRAHGESRKPRALRYGLGFGLATLRARLRR